MSNGECSILGRALRQRRGALGALWLLRLSWGTFSLATNICRWGAVHASVAAHIFAGHILAGSGLCRIVGGLIVLARWPKNGGGQSLEHDLSRTLFMVSKSPKPPLESCPSLRCVL